MLFFQGSHWDFKVMAVHSVTDEDDSRLWTILRRGAQSQTHALRRPLSSGMSCSVVKVNRRFRRARCLHHLLWRLRQQVPPKQRIHGVTSRKTIIFTVSNLRSSTLTQPFSIVKSYHRICLIILLSCCNSPQRARASTLLRLHDHILTHHTRLDTSGRTIS